jgi:hypothetical protein
MEPADSPQKMHAVRARQFAKDVLLISLPESDAIAAVLTFV